MQSGEAGFREGRTGEEGIGRIEDKAAGGAPLRLLNPTEVYIGVIDGSFPQGIFSGS